jgi:hypothetical protein
MLYNCPQHAQNFSMASCQHVFYKEIENVSRCAVYGYKALGYLSEISASRRASQHFSCVLTNPSMLYNCTQQQTLFLFLQ